MSKLFFLTDTCVQSAAKFLWLFNIRMTHFVNWVKWTNRFAPSLTCCLCIPRGKNRGVSRWVGDLLEWLLMGSISADHTWNVLYPHVSEQHIPRNSRKSPFKSCTKASWLLALSLLLPLAYVYVNCGSPTERFLEFWLKLTPRSPQVMSTSLSSQLALV